MVKFIPRHFIPLEIIVNGIVFLVSFSDSSSLVFKIQLILDIYIYPATSVNSFISSSSFLVESLGFFIYNIMSSENNDSFTSSFPIWIPFTTSSCLISMSRTSSMMLNKSGESSHLCLVPDLKGNACSLCQLSMMLASHMAFITLKYVSSIPTLLRVFIINGCCISSNAFSVSIDVICYFSPSFCLCSVSPLLICRYCILHPWNKSHLIMVYDLSNALLDILC